MADSLELLNATSRITADAFSRMENATLERAQREQQERQFNEQIGLNATQFAAEMAYKDRALSADIARNAMMAENMAFENSMEYEKFKADQELQPLRFQVQRLQLESAKEQHKRALQITKESQFGTLTKPTDIRVAAELSKNRNQDFGNGYLSIKSKYMGQVANGKPFNEEGFQNEVNALFSQYSDIAPGDEYDPSVATLMDQMGATQESARYRAQSPVFSGSLPGIKSAMLLADDNGFRSAVSQYGFMFDPQEISQLAVVKNSLNGFDGRIEQKQKEQQIILQRINSIQDPTQKQKVIDEANKIDNEIDILRKQRNSLFDKTVGFELDYGVEPDPNQDVKNELALNLSKAKKEMEEGSKTAPSPKPATMFTNDNIANAGEANIGFYTVQFPEAMSNISFKTWAGQNPRKNPEYVKSLRNRIIENLQEIPLDSRDEGYVDGEPTLETLFQSENFKKIFDNLKGNAVKGPDLYPGATGEGNYTYYGNRNFLQWAASSGMDSSGFTEIESYDDVLEQIKRFQGTKEQQRIFLEKLYSSVLAAGAVDQFSRGK